MRERVDGDRPRAVVLGAGVNALGLVRALGAARIPVRVLYVDGQDRLARHSRYCDSTRVSAAPSQEDTLLQELLSAERQGSGASFLFATSDYHVSFMSRHREALAPLYSFTIPDRDVLAMLVDKERSARAAEAAGLRVPRTVVPRSLEEARQVSDTLSFPCIVKPRDSFSVSFPGKNVVAASRDDLLDLLHDHPTLVGHLVVQQVIPGSEGGIFQCTTYVAKSGEPLAHVTMRKIHQFPPGYGVTTLGVSEWNPTLIEMTNRLARHVGFVGFASVEYKRSSDDGEYYFIEANPRLPWYNSMFLSAGVNFARLAIMDVDTEEEPDRDAERQADPIQWVYFRNEASGWWRRRKTDEGETLRELFSAVRKSRAFAYWDRKDPLPFVASMWDLFTWFVQKMLFGRGRVRRR